MKEIFFNITLVLSILLAIAATSTSVERANSDLQHVKTDFFGMMNEKRLNVLLLAYIHRDIFLDYDKIIDKYASKYPTRRLLILTFNFNPFITLV